MLVCSLPPWQGNVCLCCSSEWANAWVAVFLFFAFIFFSRGFKIFLKRFKNLYNSVFFSWVAKYYHLKYFFAMFLFFLSCVVLIQINLHSLNSHCVHNQNGFWVTDNRTSGIQVKFSFLLVLWHSKSLLLLLESRLGLSLMHLQKRKEVHFLVCVRTMHMCNFCVQGAREQDVNMAIIFSVA